MFLNDFILGIGLTSGTQVTTSQPYDEITITGQVIIESIKIYDYVMTDDELDEISLNDTDIWDSHTLFWADFEKSTLDAGNVIQLPHSITSMNIKRLEDGATSLVDIATITDLSITSYIDYSIPIGISKKFTYFIFPASDYEVGMSLQTNQIDVSSIYNHCITDLETFEVYTFDVNLTTEQISHQIDRTTYPTFQRFEKISRGLKRFATGSLEALYGNFDDVNGYSCTPDMIKALEECINRGSFKLYKTRNGEIFIVDTFDFKRKYMDEVSSQPITVTFSWEEVQSS